MCCVGLDAALGAGPHWQDVPIPHGGGRLSLCPAGSFCAVCCSLNCFDSADGVALLPHMARPGDLAVMQQHANRCRNNNTNNNSNDNNINNNAFQLMMI